MALLEKYVGNIVWIIMLGLIAAIFYSGQHFDNISAQIKNQIIAENPDCIYLEKSGLSDQHYMVCAGVITAKSLKPNVLKIEQPAQK